MHGRMQEWPLIASSVIDHAARFHARRRLVGRSVEGPIIESDWATVRRDALKIAAGLRGLGVEPGDRIGVMAWNSIRHLAIWYGVPGAGAVNHTLNPRLFDEQLIYIINHAEDRWIMVDPDIAPVIGRLRDRLTTVKGVIVTTDRANMPTGEAAAGLEDALCYEDWIAAQPEDQGWTDVDERAACGVCYTSGTTGDPKGVVYSHRSNVLHAMAVLQKDVLDYGASDLVMPVVPLFHANGWSNGYSAPMAGAGMVMPGRDLTAPALYEMLEHGVTVTLAVPTVWLGLLRFLEETGKRFSTLQRVVIGGSACPQAVLETFEDVYGVEVIHAWGMTETSPLGSFATLTPEQKALSRAEQVEAKLKIGRPFYTVDLKVGVEPTDAEEEAQKAAGRTAREAAWDGETSGRLFVRGPAVIERYLGKDESAIDDDDWFDTGDVGTIDEHGFVRITDRSKDVIKSGGEWISSIDLENIAVGHPDVAEAAAIGAPHPKWGERPILVVAAAPGATPDVASIIAHVAGHVAKWQAPDDVIVVDDIPHTATGKISKRALRDHLAAIGYRHPDTR